MKLKKYNRMDISLFFSEAINVTSFFYILTR